MRRLATALVVAALALAACRDRFVFVCRDASQCVRKGFSAGQCLAGPNGESYCAFADGQCPDGYRWDDTADPAFADVCVGQEKLDMSAGGSGGSDGGDLSIPPAYDLAGADFAFDTDAGFNMTGCSTTNNLNAVWGATTDDIWAVGDHSTIIHYRGGAPCEVQSANPGVPADVKLEGVWGRSATDVYVVGAAGTVLRSIDHGQHWTRSTIASNPELAAVGGTSALTFVAVVAPLGAVYSSPASDGTSWTQVPNLPSGGTGNPLDAFWSTPTDTWVVGNDDCNHFNGTSWSTNFAPTTDSQAGYLSGIAGYTPSTLIVVDTGGEIYRWGGTSWARPYQRNGGVCAQGFFAVATGPGRAVAVGKYGCIAVSRDQGMTWNAIDWSNSAISSFTMAQLNGVWIDPSGALVVIVGEGGLVVANPKLP